MKTVWFKQDAYLSGKWLFFPEFYLRMDPEWKPLHELHAKFLFWWKE